MKEEEEQSEDGRDTKRATEVKVAYSINQKVKSIKRCMTVRMTRQL